MKASEIRDAVEVDRRAGHQLPGLLAVEERQLELLEALVHPAAQENRDGMARDAFKKIERASLAKLHNFLAFFRWFSIVLG